MLVDSQFEHFAELIADLPEDFATTSPLPTSLRMTGDPATRSTTRRSTTSRRPHGSCWSASLLDGCRPSPPWVRPA